MINIWSLKMHNFSYDKIEKYASDSYMKYPCILQDLSFYLFYFSDKIKSRKIKKKMNIDQLLDYSELKPHQCPQCEFRFRWKVSLK